MRRTKTAISSIRIALGRAGRSTVAVALAVGVTGFVGTAAAAAGHSGAPLLPLVVRTHDGLVKGLRTTSAREFLGIPYAAPPVGRCAGVHPGQRPSGAASGWQRSRAPTARRPAISAPACP